MRNSGLHSRFTRERHHGSDRSTKHQARMLEVLPQYIVEDIINRLENARYIAYARCVCKAFNEAGKRVRLLRIVCLNEYHDGARAEVRTGSPTHGFGTTNSENSRGECSGSATSETTQVARRAGEGEGEGEEKRPLIFRETVVEILKDKPCLVQLRIEIEAKLQSKTVPEGERKKTDHWLSDQLHLRKWIPSVQTTLQHLCIVDYGQQAIMRRTNILKLLSHECKVLKTLDLRNMFIDSGCLEDMPQMTSFTMRCVKVTGDALQDINDHMQNLQTLALLGVFGVTQGNLTFPHMKVLCLGLSTMAKEVTVDLPNLVKLQLKMQCPEKLSINALSLKFIAFNLEVRESSKVELKNIHVLQELLYGASDFATLSRLVTRNPDLDKVFLDIPCMALGEDGKWLGVLKGIPLNLPIFGKLQQCGKLAVLNVGPGLWHSMEVNVYSLATVEKWPPVKRLILHMIPQRMDTCLTILRILVRSSLTSLEVYVHTNSPVGYEEIVPKFEEMVSGFGQDFKFTPRLWTKSLDFSCFSF